MLKTAQSIFRLFCFALPTFASCVNFTSVRRAALAFALLMVGIPAPVKADIIITVTGVVTSYSGRAPSLVGQPITIIADLVPSTFTQLFPPSCDIDQLCYQGN